MNYDEVLANARNHISDNCRVCPVCNGLACGNTMPGPGSKAPGNGAHENYLGWQKIRLNMDTIVEALPIDTSTQLFGRTFSFPLMSAPIGSIAKQFNPTDDVSDFNEDCIAACESRGILHAYGTGLEQRVWDRAIASGIAHGNSAVPVFNPDTTEHIKAQMDFYKGKPMPPAWCVVVDSAGLPHLKSMMGGKGATKSVSDLRELREYVEGPFIIKGIMTVKGALKALEAGADAIIVSNHGGRVLSDTPSTAEVLPEIADAVKGRMKILVDGGIRSGLDVFKAIALGADLCLICRPVLISWYGGGQEGIECYFDKIRAEFEDTMYMCGVHSVSEISRENIRRSGS